MREYASRPGYTESHRAYKKAHCQKPEVKEKRREYLRNYRSDPRNLEKISLQMKAYYQRPEIKRKVKAFSNEYQKERRKSDINFSLRLSLRGRLWYALKLGKGIKLESAVKLVGCSIPTLRKYLESKFSEGMSWENHSPNGWHIDHIIPCAAFDLKEIDQQRKCFHYTNLQPLWAEENHKKSNKIL